MFDLKIEGGTIVDGTGAQRYQGDVAIADGRIVGVGAAVEGEARRTIDAKGRIVTPGFVDIHTHYDGQVTWDELLEPSSGHGVTTIVMGNCGVGFAPVKPGKEEWLIQLMEGVEDIPGSALSEGIQWEWETFPGYLDSLAKKRTSVDFGAQIAHGAVRGYVMGDRGARNEPATTDDIAQMRELVREAIEAGALGVSTSRVLGHRAMDGEPVPGPLRPRMSSMDWAMASRMQAREFLNWLLPVPMARTSSMREKKWIGCGGSRPKSDARSPSHSFRT